MSILSPVSSDPFIGGVPFSLLSREAVVNIYTCALNGTLNLFQSFKWVLNFQPAGVSIITGGPP